MIDDEQRMGPVTGCFLCRPSATLLAFERGNFFCLAGLGPIVESYAVLGVRSHHRSMADLPDDVSRERDATVDYIRNRLSEKYGSCLITEHGRMAVCETTEFDPHCFHGHFLLFPGAPDISDKTASYFSQQDRFDDLGSAMRFAATCDEYILVSPEPNQFNVFSGPLNIPRQLTRVMVASKLDRLSDAHWGDHPHWELAEENAEILRRILSTDHV